MSDQNQRGLTLVDTLLALVILFFLTSTLVPLTVSMKQQVAVKQKQAHAAEVAFNGALKYKRYGEVNGQQELDETFYTWVFVEGGICVTYEINGVEEELCV